jgi:hypothetical protein
MPLYISPPRIHKQTSDDIFSDKALTDRSIKLKQLLKWKLHLNKCFVSSGRIYQQQPYEVEKKLRRYFIFIFILFYFFCWKLMLLWRASAPYAQARV